MAGTGPAPKDTRRRTNEPARGDWQATPGIGWQHGEIPKPPPRMAPATRKAWVTWFQAWFAAHWTPDDLPMLRQLVRLYDKVERDDATAAERTELRQLADNYGLTPKGQQDRRWKRPEAAPAEPDTAPPEDDAGPYGHLRVVDAAAKGA